MPTPPVTINAPVVVEDAFVVVVMVILGTIIPPSALADIVVPPRSIVELLTNNVLNLAVGLPKSYVFDWVGSMCPVTKSDPLSADSSLTTNFPPIPTPPVTTNAPVLVEVEVNVLFTVNMFPSKVNTLVPVATPSLLYKTCPSLPPTGPTLPVYPMSPLLPK